MRSDKMSLIRLILLLLVFLKTVIALSDCHELDVQSNAGGSSKPILGSNLPYCPLDKPQCCTVQYFNTFRNNTTTELMSGLHKDLEITLLSWVDAYKTTTDTINQFSTLFVNVLPFPHSIVPLAKVYLNAVKTNLNHQLHPNYTVDLNFDFEKFVHNITSTLVDIFTQALPYPGDQIQCLDNLLHEYINSEHIKNIGQSFKQLQYVMQSLKKITNFLIQFRKPNSLQFLPSNQCIEAVLKQYCSSCVRNIPKLCESVCVPVISACQSPVYEGLKPQLEAVWNVSRQLLELTQSLMNQTLRVDGPLILPANILHSLQQKSLERCKIDLSKILSSSRRRRRYLEDYPLPSSLQPAVTKVFSLSGVFNKSIPTFCLSKAINTNCWNGSSVVANDTTTTLLFSIEHQRHNQVHSFNIKQLYVQAAQLGTQVVDYLQSSDFQQTLPENVSIPAVTAPPTSNTTDEPTSSTTDEATSNTTEPTFSTTEEPTDHTTLYPTVIIIYPFNGSNSFYQLNQLSTLLILLLPTLLIFFQLG